MEKKFMLNFFIEALKRGCVYYYNNYYFLFKNLYK